jgi:hypothetical protein
LATTSLFGASALAGLTSRFAYGRYKDAMTPGDASHYYNRARDFRSVATTLSVSGIMMWTGSAIEAAWKQSRQNRHIRAVAVFGGSR